MFNSILAKYLPTNDPNYVNSNGWREAGTPAPVSNTGDSDYQNPGSREYSYGRLPPEYLAAMGFNGPAFNDVMTGEGDNREMSFGGNYSPELQKWMADKGLTSQLSAGEAGGQQQFFQGMTPYGPGTRWGESGDDAFSIAAILAGGAVGAGVAGAGAAGAAGASGAGVGTGGTMGAQAIEAAAASGGAGVGTGGAMGAQAIEAAAAESAAAGGAGGGTFAGTGAQAIENAALAGSSSAAPELGAGYATVGGGGVTTAGTTAGTTTGTSSPGFLKSVAAGNWGDAASAAGNWATSGDGLRTLGGLASSYIGSKASSNALDAQVNATNQANQLQRDIYNQNRADWTPYRDLGKVGTQGITNLLQNPNSIKNDPGYQFGLDQGQTALDRSAAGRGSLYSGATLKALDRFGQDYGGTKLNEGLQRYSNAAQLGATGTSASQAGGSNYANQTGANLSGLAGAQGWDAMQQGTLWQNALNGAASTYGKKP